MTTDKSPLKQAWPSPNSQHSLLHDECGLPRLQAQSELLKNPPSKKLRKLCCAVVVGTREVGKEGFQGFRRLTELDQTRRSRHVAKQLNFQIEVFKWVENIYPCLRSS